MFSNSDWGATSYLSNSVYGSGAAEVYINNCYITSPTSNYNGRTGWGGATASASVTAACVPGANDAGAYHTAQGQKASTTATVYGIYDMSGGNYEYVLGNYNKTSSTSYWPAANFTNYTKYYDAYMTADGFSSTTGAGPAWSSSTNYYLFNLDVCNFSLCGGQANYETTVYQSVSSYLQSWGSDDSYFVYSSEPWFLRGAASNGTTYAGLFSSSRTNGGANYYFGCRPSLSAY
jgi:hypothetical protein